MSRPNPGEERERERGERTRAKRESFVGRALSLPPLRAGGQRPQDRDDLEPDEPEHRIPDRVPDVVQPEARDDVAQDESSPR